MSLVMATATRSKDIIKEDGQGKYHDPSCLLCDGNPFVDDHEYTPATQVESTDVSTVTDDEEDEDLVEKTLIVDTVPFTPLKSTKRKDAFKKPDKPPKKCKFIKLMFYSPKRCRVECSATRNNVTRIRTYVRHSKERNSFEHKVYLFQ